MADYVDNKELLAELKVYRVAYLASIEAGAEKPQVSDKIAQAIVQIATNLGRSHNFRGYSYLEEMIGDAIVKCLSKVHRFDPEISENPFGLFTQISWQCFIFRIKKEQKETSVKARMINEMLSSEFVEHGGAIDNEDVSNSFVQFLKENDVLVDHIAAKKQKIHPSLIHRNKTAYPTKKASNAPVDLFEEV
jgi:hypothetical protein